MSDVDERVLVASPTAVVADQPPRWYRDPRLTVAILVVGVLLIVVGVVAFVQRGSTDSEADIILAEGDAAISRVAELEADMESENAKLAGARAELVTVEARTAAIEAEIDQLESDRALIDQQLADAAVWLAAIDEDAGALRNAVGDQLSGIGLAVAADGNVAADLAAAVEAGNRRDLATMTRRLEASKAELATARDALDQQEAALSALETLVLEVEGASAAGILATESFDDSASGWTVSDFSDGTVGYVDGGYQIVARTDAAVMGFMPLTISDVAVEVDVDPIDAPDGTYEYGIMCRSRETSTATEGYLASVGATHVRIAAFDSRGMYEELTPWQDLLEPSSETRRIAVTCDGEQIALYVDGDLVVETPGIGLQGTSVGLFLVSYDGDEVTARFDNLRLLHPSVMGVGDEN